MLELVTSGGWLTAPIIPALAARHDEASAG